MEFKVSVIIPVYNAEPFLRQAVESSVQLSEVGEVILVEDGSSDNSIALCTELTQQYERVKLFRHPSGQNKGAAESRNLGIENATCEFIAFLDADDWYLPFRFVRDKEVFSNDHTVDAVYSCTILENDQEDFLKRRGVKTDPKIILGSDLSPSDFYRHVLEKKLILYNTNSITLRKQFLLMDKLFDERLKLHQDTELWLRLLRRGNFCAGEIDRPVAIIRRHENNRITTRTRYSQLTMWSVFVDNIGLENLYSFEIDYIFKAVLRTKSKTYNSSWMRRFYYYFNLMPNWLQKRKYVLKQCQLRNS